MKLHKTTEIIDAMIGPISPTGDHGKDVERFQNMEDLFEVMNHYVRLIEDISERNNAPQESIKLLGQKAYEYRNKLTAWEQ